MNELRTNAKYLSQEGQYQIRRNIIRLSQKGHPSKAIAEMLDVSLRLVQATKKTYREEGFVGIKSGKRGRKTGDKRILTPDQEKHIQKAIIDNNPDQLKLPCCLWTRRAIHDYINREFGIDMPLSTLGYYLERWGFSVQRPVKRSAKQDSGRIANWLEEEYPSIEKRARDECCEIYWGDETSIQNTSNYVKGYSPIGHTPVLEVQPRNMKLNMLSAISNKGKLRFTITKESVNSDILIDFMRRLAKDSARKVFLILDNLRVHHSKKVRSWLKKHRDRVEVFYLPPYAPEYNPDEYLNGDMKRSIEKRSIPKSEKELSTSARSFLKQRQVQPEKVKAYFNAKHTKYAMEKRNV